MRFLSFVEDTINERKTFSVESLLRMLDVVNKLHARLHADFPALLSGAVVAAWPQGERRNAPPVEQLQALARQALQ